MRSALRGSAAIREPRGAGGQAPQASAPHAETTYEQAHAFAWQLLEEQGVPTLARRAEARALALLLERSLERPGSPVVLSAEEAARACSFEPRTWWHVKKRLLERGHLLASSGGKAPSGRPGGRGHKAGYFVAPKTLELFSERSLKAREETLKARSETLKAPREERDLSHHRGASFSLRLLEKKETSDVSSLEENETPSPEALWREIRRERSPRLKLRLLRLLETVLLGEVLERVLASHEGDGVKTAKSETLNPESGRAESGKAPRRPRAGSPLWSAESGEEKAVFEKVREVLLGANREHGARFDVERSAKDTLLYPFERVRAGVANVLLKRARGYRFANPGAVLWDGITLEGYKLDEFSVGPWDEILRRLRGGPTPAAPPPPPPGLPRAPAPPPEKRPDFEPERQRRKLLQALYEKLPEDARAKLDERAASLAREELGGDSSPLRLSLRKLDKRNELLLREHRASLDAEWPRDESQIPIFGSARDEPEPIRDVEART